MNLQDALAVVRASGYRVTKPKARARKQSRVGPTCVTHFIDGSVFRMTTHTTDDNLDFARGIRLCALALASRHGHDCVPPVEYVHFERDGVTIGEQIP